MSTLTAWTAVAVCNAVERVCGVRPGIKWPNDVILDGRKLCGILTELELEAETAALRHVVVGVGINLTQTAADFGPEVAPVAVSLAQALGRAPRRAEMAAAVLAALLVFRRQADDRALLAAAVVLAIGVPFLLPHMHERYFFLADVLALAWTCAFPRSAPCALLVELASLGRLCGGPAGEIYPGGLPGWPPVPHAVRGPAHAGRPGLCGPLPRPPTRLPSKNPESNSLSPTIWHAGTNFL